MRICFLFFIFTFAAIFATAIFVFFFEKHIEPLVAD